eukprot:TRINITY_DN10365_c0_g1_i2.p2 TRINITY_DN10365_c0_g1~~TRINITY_DN10365_c0_g1_i2.p2  ORF type:complete len:101 (-),score=2.09 TRINITY_DN10365_c0_g1_i2:149-451(-)
MVLQSIGTTLAHWCGVKLICFMFCYLMGFTSSGPRRHSYAAAWQGQTDRSGLWWFATRWAFELVQAYSMTAVTWMDTCWKLCCELCVVVIPQILIMISWS